MSYLLLFTIMIGVFSCETTPDTPPSDRKSMEANSSEVAPDHEVKFEDLWFKGSIEEAFALAKKENKPLFVYWGAVWCPPCNEMKSNVFNQLEFRELMKAAIPVYLDGDTESAQVWGEKLNSAGYPTLMFLNPQGKEIMRIATGVTMEEFSKAFKSALALTLPFEQMVEKAVAGKASRNELRALAYLSWGQMGHLNWDTEKKLKTSLQLVEQVPLSYEEERVLFIEHLLSAAESAHSELEASKEKDRNKKEIKSLRATLEKVEQQLQSYFDVLFANQENIVLVRGSLIYGADKLLPWFKKIKGKALGETYTKKWMAALESIRTNRQLSIDTRLWTVYPKIKLVALDQKPKDEKKAEKGSKEEKKVFSKELVNEVKSAVELAEREAKTPYERKAVISGAAYLLRQVEAIDEARTLLLAEVKKSDTPYYYQSSLASLEKDAGNKEKALYWAAAARESAKGRATRLQWIYGDLRLSMELSERPDDKRVAKLLEEFYETTFGLEDGFDGRNGRIVNRLGKQLKDALSKNKTWKSVVQSYQDKCKTLNDSNKNKCLDHFSEINK